MDHFKVHIQQPGTDELPEEVRRGFHLLAKIIAGQIRESEREARDSVLFGHLNHESDNDNQGNGLQSFWRF